MIFDLAISQWIL